MVQSSQQSWQVAIVITNHGLVQLLVMHVIAQSQILWETFWESTKEEIVAVIATRGEELVATEEE